jgi:gamma-glutamylcyclotransferase (GGCT)/AIG2-like uncharacterized protein YtfP
MPQTTPIFAYGTLMYGELLALLLGRVPDSAPGTLHGYARYAITGEKFPGIVPADGQAVQGLLLHGLSAAELAIFDDYESDFYDRLSVTVQTQTGEVTALVYVINPNETHILAATPWDAQGFATHHLADYAAKLRARLQASVGSGDSDLR